MKKLIFAFICLPLLSYSQKKLSPELLWEIGRIGEVKVSPDQSKLIYTLTYYNLTENKANTDLYLIDLDAPSPSSNRLGAETLKSVQLTDWDGGEFSPVWHPGSKKIAFLSAKSGSIQAWESKIEGGEPSQLTNVEGGITNFAYAPDGKHISFTKDVKLDQTINELYPDLPYANARVIDDLMYRHWNQWHDYAYSHVCYMNYKDGKVYGDITDIMEGERFDSPLNPFGGAEQIGWSPDGKIIAYTCKKKRGKSYATSTNSDIYLYNLTNHATTNLTEGMPGYDTEPVFSPDGTKIAWLSMERDGFESDRNRIFTYDFTTAKSKELTKGFDQSAGSLHWSKQGDKIYFTSVVNATYQVYAINPDAGTINQLTEGIHNYYSVAEADGFLIGTRCSMSSPTEIYKIYPEAGTQKMISNVNGALLSQVRMGKVEKRMIETTDGKDMLTWVIYPPNFDPKKKYPTLLYCQGGPQSAVSQFFSYRWNFQLMAAYGYIVVAPNRRGLPGFGQAWNDQISGDWGGQAMQDYLSAIDAVSEEPFVDKEKLGAVGASYGGYSVYYLAGIHEKRFKAFISHCGLFNLESWYGSTEEMFFANWDLQGPYWGKPVPKSYSAFSPHKLVGNWDTPILVVHGEKDFRVPVTEGMQAFSAAQLQNIPSRFLYFPKEGHWVLSPQNGVLWHRVFFEWLDKWLK